MLNTLFSKFFFNGLNKQNNHVHDNYVTWIVHRHWTCKIYDARIIHIILQNDISYTCSILIAIHNT